ncbi:MAG: hypothetical protein U9R68_00490, partial [Planctomycetota bacterium]|nr:hypothetical protein [Planctomycetota bacterium]
MKHTRTIPAPVLAVAVAAAVAMAAVLALPAQAAKWRYPIKDLRKMVAEADAVVRGRMVRAEVGSDEKAVAVIEVQQVLLGACPDAVRILNTGPPGRSDCA